MKNTLKLSHSKCEIVMDRTFAKLAENTMSAEYAHGVYYYCKSIEFNGVKLYDLEVIYDLTLEILRGKPD